MPRDNSKPQRERRAREAQERQAERAKRSGEDQAHALNLRDTGNAARERKRLAA